MGTNKQTNKQTNREFTSLIFLTSFFLSHQTCIDLVISNIFPTVEEVSQEAFSHTTKLNTFINPSSPCASDDPSSFSGYSQKTQQILASHLNVHVSNRNYHHQNHLLCLSQQLRKTTRRLLKKTRRLVKFILCF